MGNERTYVILINPDRRGFKAVCPAVPAITSQGRTSFEALHRMEVALRVHLADLVASGQEAPLDDTAVQFVKVDPEECLV